MSASPSRTGPQDLSGEPRERTDTWNDVDTLPLADVRDLFQTFAKALRAFQLYDENNPVYRRFVSSLAEAFRRLWPEMDRLTVGIGEETFTLGPAEVYRSESRSDSLAFLFFKDGVRQLTLLPGVEDDELTRFLSVLQQARRARAEGDDLLTLLWEADLQHVRYQYVDVLAEGVVPPEPGGGASEAELRGLLQVELPVEEAPEAEEAASPTGSASGRRSVSREDFNPTLYSLDPRELEQLRAEVEREVQRDLRGSVLAALFDRLEEPGHRQRQSEILAILRQLLPSFLSRGELQSATLVLAQVQDLERVEGVFDEPRRAEARALVDAVSTPESIEELVRALEDGSVRPTAERLGAFLSQLRAGALGPLIRAAETTEVRELRGVLREAVRGIAGRHRDAVLRLMGSEDPLVAAGAARLAGRMQIADAAGDLVDLMRHGDARVRLAAVEAARDLRASVAAGALVDVLGDPDRDVRIAAARVLADLRYRPAERAMQKVLGSRGLKDADLSERIALFESYGAVAGEAGVDLLDRLLNGRGFLGRRESAETRACAALGLGRIDTEAARDALRRAGDEDEPVVRSAINRALRGQP